MDREEQQRLLDYIASVPRLVDTSEDERKARGFIHCCFAARDASIPTHELFMDTMRYMRGFINPSYVYDQIDEARQIYAAIPRY